MTTRQFYSLLAVQVGPSPATGYHFSTGFNGAVTGANSGANLIQTLERVQSISDGFSIERQNVLGLGILAPLSREINTPPQIDVSASYLVADLSNERILGFYVSGNQGCLTNILNRTQADKNMWLVVAPQGSDAVGYTGNKSSMLFSNCSVASWSTEGAVGGFPTTTVALQGFNYATYTGSVNQDLLAINPNNGNYVTGIKFTLPTPSSGISNTVPVLKPQDISVDISSAAIGLDVSDLKIQSYNISFDLNLQPLNKLGSLYPYAREPQYPVNVTMSVTAYWGDIVTGSLRNILCSDNPYNLSVRLNQPCGGTEAVRYTLLGAKPDSQAFDGQDVSSVASQVTITYTAALGGNNDTNTNFLMSGINI